MNTYLYLDNLRVNFSRFTGCKSKLMSIYCLFGLRVGFIIECSAKHKLKTNSSICKFSKRFIFCVFGHFRFAHNRSMIYVRSNFLFHHHFMNPPRKDFWLWIFCRVQAALIERLKRPSRLNLKILDLTGGISPKYSLKLALFSYDNHRVFTTFEFWKYQCIQKSIYCIHIFEGRSYDSGYLSRKRPKHRRYGPKLSNSHFETKWQEYFNKRRVTVSHPWKDWKDSETVFRYPILLND